MNSRRRFLRKSALFSTLGGFVGIGNQSFAGNKFFNLEKRPIVVSTWNHGIAANAAAWEILSAGGKAIDAVEAGVKVTEADPKVKSVGFGGYPDRDGRVTLDACISSVVVWPVWSISNTPSL
jgi:L-asparaginase/N4-(beta-N-acetylglucosaminyl)-L-asparaginase